MANWPADVLVPRYVSFGSVLRDVALDQSMIPEQDGLEVGVAAMLARGISMATRYAYEYYDWPDAFVWATFVPQGHPVALIPFVPRKYLNLQLDCVTEMWTVPPHIDPDAACPVEFTLGPDGFYLPGYEGDRVSVRFRPPPPRFVTTPWDATTIYPVGALVFDAAEPDPALAHVYKQTGNAPVSGNTLTDANVWTPQPILYALEEPIKAGASALYIRTEGQAGTAQLLDGAMVHLLEQQIIQIENQMEQTKEWRRRRRNSP